MDISKRVALRWAAKEQEIPVYNKRKDRVVYVLPETVQQKPGVYEKVPATMLDNDGKIEPKGPRRRQPHLPRKPRKPYRPEIDRKPPPTPVHPPVPPKPPLPPKAPKPVKPVKPPKVPEPSKPNKYRRLKKYLHAASDEQLSLVARVLERSNCLSIV